MLNKRKIALIFGVSGQDGAYLAEFLLRKGYEVHGTSRDAELSSFKNLKFLNIREKVCAHSVAPSDFRSVLQCLREVNPTEIYNLSGQSSVGLSFSQPIETFESISLTTLNILESMRFLELDAKFYNACSGECFGGIEVPANENTKFHPKSPYGAAKAASFWQVTNYREAYGISACSGILFNHESPLRPNRFVTKKIVSTAVRIAGGSKEKLVLGDIAIERDWGWAPDYVEAMWLMLQKNSAEDYVIATGLLHSLKNFIEQTFQDLGLDWNQYVCVSKEILRPLDIQRSCGNPEKALKQLGWKPKHLFPEIISAMIEAEKEKE